MRRVPEGTDLLFLAPGRKDLLLYGQGNDVLQMLSGGITAAGLPLSHRTSGDPKQVGQARLRQANARPQAQHGLTKGIVALTIGEPLHRRAPFLPRDPPAPGQQWEVMGSNMPTAGRCLPQALSVYW